MQTDIDRARYARRAFGAIFVSVVGIGLAVGFLNVNGPGWLFYCVGAFVGALLALDLWLKFRAERSDRALLRMEQDRLSSTAADERTLVGVVPVIAR